MISIGAVDWNRNLADFSTFNADVELAAPGEAKWYWQPLAGMHEFAAASNQDTIAYLYAHFILVVTVNCSQLAAGTLSRCCCSYQLACPDCVVGSAP